MEEIISNIFNKAIQNLIYLEDVDIITRDLRSLLTTVNALIDVADEMGLRVNAINVRNN